MRYLENFRPILRLGALGLLVALVAVFAARDLQVSFADGPPAIAPAAVEALLLPGGSMDVVKTVHTPALPPNPDICFLADTTGSMGGAIANVQASATAIMNTVAAGSTLAQFCAAEYRDTGDIPDFALNQALTPTIANVQAAINGWAAGGGGDTPEGQLHALTLLSGAATGWRPVPPATHIIVWFGDAPGHDPSIGGETLASTIAALTLPPPGAGAPIIVIAISTGFDQLDSTGQATAITGATGGPAVFHTPNPNDVAAAILAALSSLPVEVAMVSDCAAPISASFAPASQVVTSGTDAVFTETISVAVGAAAGTYTCRDWATLNGEPMTDANGVLIVETKTIHVPGIDLLPPTATNELGTPGQTHTVTAVVSAGAFGPVAGMSVAARISAGPNSPAALGVGITDAAGEVQFTYVALQGPAGLGTDTIVACFRDAADNPVCDTATKDWVDTTPPVASCVETVNPAGKNVPNAPGTGGKAQNPDGFYKIGATDAVWPAADLDVFVTDEGSGTVFGPYPVGTNIKYTEANGATPSAKPIGGPGSAVTVHIKGTGDAAVHAVDGSGNVSAKVSCLVPPKPQ